MKKTFVLFLMLSCASMSMVADNQRYVGGDISMLPRYEKYNSKYKDVKGTNINDLLVWFKDVCHWNTFRVRIFVNPQSDKDPAVCQDLEYVKALGKRIKDAGAFFMLDFHYSDYWVDAGQIQAPRAWKGSSDAVMADSISSYTKRVLNELVAAGAQPDLVQVGNEIMYGLCDIRVHPYDYNGDNWDGYLGLLRAGCNAVREVCPDAQIIIHSDRPTNRSYNFYYYNKLRENGVDYDIIGLSYYPFWHGYLTVEQVADKSNKDNLVSAINTLKVQFPEKRVHIVECAYNFQWWPSSGVNFDTRDAWPCSVAGQYNFVKDLVDALKPLENLDGINYWFPEEAGNGDYGNVMPSWLNRGFWDENKSTSGHAINSTGNVSALKTAEDVCAPYYMGTFVDNPGEGLGVTDDGLRETGKKAIRDGQVIIETNEQTYTIDGKKL